MNASRLFRKLQGSLTNNKGALLVRAMHELELVDNPENRRQMYQALLSSTLLVPTPEVPNNAPDGVSLQLCWISDESGCKLVPVFTDIEALTNWDPNIQSLSVQARGLFETLLTYFTDVQGIVINPSAPTRKRIRPTFRITRAELVLLERGRVPEPAELGLTSSRVHIVSLENMIQPTAETLPETVSRALNRSAQDVLEISVIYLFSMASPQHSPRLTLGIGLDGTVAKERGSIIAQTLWTAVASGLANTELETLDFVVLTLKIAPLVESVGTKVYQKMTLNDS